MVLTLWQLCKAQWFYFSVCCKFNLNSALLENWKESSSRTISTETSFNDDCNGKTLNVNKVCQQ